MTTSSLFNVLTHIVFTRNKLGKTQLYIDGKPIEPNLKRGPNGVDKKGNFDLWENMQLALANEVSGTVTRAWLGEYHQVAIYSRALTETEVKENYDKKPFKTLLRTPNYGWAGTGLLIKTSLLETSSYHSAATIIPAPNQNPPNSLLNFVVSPYLGLAFLSNQSQQSLESGLLVGELVCFNTASQKLLPVASHSWEFDNSSDLPVQGWAIETHLRLCPTSPIALVRLRYLYTSDNNLDISIDYRFSLIEDIQLPEIITRRTSALRSSVKNLLFREGQQGISEMPKDIKAFELAPTQVTGVQPVVLNNDSNSLPTIPWGFSALRFSVRHAETSAIGSSVKTNGTAKPFTLWWQAPQHFMQYADNAGLPNYFRGKAIKNLLPVISNPPFPIIRESDPTHSSIQEWQPILPNKLSYWLIGTRSGVMIALRHQLLRQHFNGQKSKALVSSSLPIQHRSPRPVSLPPNKTGQEAFALQTWASYLEPESNLFVSNSPADEAFFTDPNRRLMVILESPSQGVILSDWDGRLKLRFKSRGAKDHPWTLTLKIIDGGQVFVYPMPEASSKHKDPKVDPGVNVDSEWKPNADLGRADLDRIVKILDHLKSKANNSRLTLQLQVTSNDDLTQILDFPLYVRSETNLNLPLTPYFVLFEDPEYNRHLASAPAKSARQLQKSDGELTLVSLACDRKEYNIFSSIFLRYDHDGDLPNPTLKLKYIFRGIPKEINLTGISIENGKLILISLPSILNLAGNLNVQLESGGILQFELSFSDAERIEKIYLEVSLVSQPVTPVPQAGYALLRRQTLNNINSVECVRFSWSPNPSRIELISAEDLRSDIVRRRAIFQWCDSARINSIDNRDTKDSDGYNIQKITPLGSTNIPANFHAPEGKQEGLI